MKRASQALNSADSYITMMTTIREEPNTAAVNKIEKQDSGVDLEKETVIINDDLSHEESYVDDKILKSKLRSNLILETKDQVISAMSQYSPLNMTEYTKMEADAENNQNF